MYARRRSEPTACLFRTKRLDPKWFFSSLLLLRMVDFLIASPSAFQTSVCTKVHKSLTKPSILKLEEK